MKYGFNRIRCSDMFCHLRTIKAAGKQLLILLIYLATSSSFALSAQGFTVDAHVLSIEKAIKTALENNRSIKISEVGIHNQEYALEAAKSDFDAKVFPSLSADIGNSTAGNNPTSYGGGVTVSKRFALGTVLAVNPSLTRTTAGDTVEGVSLSLIQPLMRGAGTAITLQSIYDVQYSLRRAKRTHYISQVNTILNTVTAFYNVGKYEMFVALYEAVVDNLERHALTARAKEKAGIATQIDVLRADLELNNAQSSLEQMKESHQSQLDLLKSILSLPMQESVTVVAFIKVLKLDTPEDTAIQMALNHRVEAKQMEDDLQESHRRVGLAENALLPELNIVVSHDITRTLKGGPTDKQWTLGFATSTDLARSREKSAYRRALLDEETIQLQAKTLEENIIRETRSQLRILSKASQIMYFRQLQIKQAEGKLALAKVKFDHSQGDNFDVITAEKELIDSRINLINAQIDYLTGSYRLKAVMGTLL
ncbi:MAG: TolC family protein [Mariprofundaceae bacterium]